MGIFRAIKTGLFSQGGSGSVSGSSSGVAGDIKFGFQPADHSGWIRMDGRLKTALTSGQQSAATTLGFGVNIPDARDRSMIAASGSKAQLTTGGAASLFFAQNQLPNLALSVTGSIQSRVSINVSNTPRESGVVMNSYNDGSGTSSPAVNGSTASMNGGVTQQPLPTQSPYLAANCFVYLGL
jgi:hypothetical protein